MTDEKECDVVWFRVPDSPPAVMELSLSGITSIRAVEGAITVDTLFRKLVTNISLIKLGSAPTSDSNRTEVEI